MTSSLALVSLSTWIPGNPTEQNHHGVAAKLYAKGITDYDLSVILPTGWNRTIQTVTLTGQQISDLLASGYDAYGNGKGYPYVLVSPVQPEAGKTYQVAICGVSDQLAAEATVTDSGVVGMDAAKAFFGAYTTISRATGSVSVFVGKGHQTLVSERAGGKTQHGRELIALLLVAHDHRVDLLDDLRVESPGDEVMVGVRSNAGARAVLLAYVGALVVLLAALGAAKLLGGSDGQAVVAALGGVSLYYGWHRRHRPRRSRRSPGSRMRRRFRPRKATKPRRTTGLRHTDSRMFAERVADIFASNGFTVFLFDALRPELLRLSWPIATRICSPAKFFFR